MLADYKKKYDEFAGAMKKSRKTIKVYEGEIKNLNTRALELATIKRKLLQGENQKKKKSKDDVSVEKKNQELEKMLNDWADEKKALEKEKEDLMAQSKTLQDEIKILNSGKGGAGGV